jgi:hypothetical protein
MFDSTDQSLVAVCMLLYVSIAAAAIVVFDNAGEQEEDEVQQELKSEQLVQCLRLFRRLEKRRLALEDEANEQVAKKPKKVKFDYERARACVYQDYLGPDPLFEKYFERIFRVSRGITEQLIQICSGTHSFFTSTTNKVTGEKSIYPEVKVLMALMLALTLKNLGSIY